MFITPLEYKFTSNEGDTVIKLMHQTNTAYYKIPIAKSVSSILIDPNNWIINKATVTKDSTLSAVGEHFYNKMLLNVFPNPATNVLNIKDALFGEEFKIYDVAGRLMMADAFNGNDIDITSLPNGFYVVHVTGSTQQGVARFIKGN